jgi:hypothetical protein
MDIWSTIHGLEGATLHTLDPNRSQSFTIEDVNENGIALRSAGGSRIFINRDKILDCWSMLVDEQKIDLNINMLVELKLGRSSSYIAAILARIPGVLFHTKPIVLEYRKP